MASFGFGFIGETVIPVIVPSNANAPNDEHINTAPSHALRCILLFIFWPPLYSDESIHCTASLLRLTGFRINRTNDALGVDRRDNTFRIARAHDALRVARTDEALRVRPNEALTRRIRLRIEALGFARIGRCIRFATLHDDASLAALVV